MPLANRFAQFRRSAGVGVLGEVGIDRVDGGLLDVGGRREIRLASAEIDDVDAFAAQAVRIGRDLHRGRNTDRGDTFGYFSGGLHINFQFTVSAGL